MNPKFFTAKTSAEYNIQARRSPVALASRRVAFCLAIASTLLTACISLPITPVTGNGGAILSQDATGYIFTDSGYKLWLSETVPANYFTSTPAGEHITFLLWSAGNSIRLHRANQQAPPPPPAKTP